MIHLDQEALDDATTVIVKCSYPTWDDAGLLAEEAVGAYQNNLAHGLMTSDIKMVHIETDKTPPTRNGAEGKGEGPARR